jgi:hypothetical protein
MGGGGMKENGGGGEFKWIYLTHCKNFCKYHSVPLPRTMIKIFFKKEGRAFMTHLPYEGPTTQHHYIETKFPTHEI